MTLRFVRFGWWVNIRSNLVIGSPSNLLMNCRLSDYQLYHYETSDFLYIVELLELLESIHFCFHLGGDVGMNPFAENSHPNVAPVSLDPTEDRRVGRWLGWYRRVPWNSDKLGRTNADLRHVAFRYVYICTYIYIYREMAGAYPLRLSQQLLKWACVKAAVPKKKPFNHWGLDPIESASCFTQWYSTHP